MKPAKSVLSSSTPRESSSTLTAADLKTLRAPFPADRLGVKIQSLSREKTRALLVLYLQHTDVQDRLEEVDPAWSWEIIGEERIGDTVYVRSRMTLKGVSRENVGEGGDPKSACSDSLKRCAMLFGIGRYLYDSETVWANYDESKDRYRQWSVDDYNQAAKRTSRAGAVTQESEALPGLKTSVEPAVSSTQKSGKKAASRPREELNRQLMALYRPYLTRFPDTQFSALLNSRYQVGETRLMTVEQIEDLVKFMQHRMDAEAQAS